MSNTRQQYDKALELLDELICFIEGHEKEWQVMAILASKVCNKRELFNSNNHHEYSPFIYNCDSNKLDIANDWWQSLPEFVKTSIIDSIGEQNISIKNECIQVPHQFKGHELEINTYFVYIHSFDYQLWYQYYLNLRKDELEMKSSNNLNMPKDVILIELNEYNKEKLKYISNKRCLTGKELNSDDIETMQELIDIIDNKLDQTIKDRNGYFGRLSSNSAKNEFKLEPLHSGLQVLDYITKCAKFIRQEYSSQTRMKNKQTFLVLIPWNSKIQSNNEFRIFVRNGKLTGIAQQKWYKKLDFTPKQLEIIMKAINKQYVYWCQCIPFTSFVADVWVDFENGQAYFLECNPFGIWAASGSSLFHWVHDYDVLYGRKGKQFRYVV